METWEQILQKELEDAFAIGITSMSGPDLIPAMRASQIAQSMKNKVHVMWGGHHSSALQDEIFNENMADYVFLGPAEYTFPKVLDCLFEKKNFLQSLKEFCGETKKVK